jgi:hypothetical protein
MGLVMIIASSSYKLDISLKPSFLSNMQVIRAREIQRPLLISSRHSGKGKGKDFPVLN